MSSFCKNLLIIVCFLFFNNPNSISGKISYRPKALVLKVSKDPSTNQYLTTLNQRTPLVPIKLTLDLNGPCLWTDCQDDFVSSSYKRAHCGSALCKLPSKLVNCTNCHSNPSSSPICHTNSCGFYAENPVAGIIWPDAEIGQDVLSIQSTNGSNPGRFVTVPKFTSTCAVNAMLQSLANGVRGMAGLGRNKISLPYQFSSTFGFPKKFALCLSPSSRKGVVFFGDGPYVLQPTVDVAKSLTYTPLIRNPVNLFRPHFEIDPSSDYYIRVRSIKVNGKIVPFNKALLQINEKGYGGTKISTLHPYTTMHSEIYNAVMRSFDKELGHIPRVPAVEPFGVCYNYTFMGVAMIPTIDLVLQSKKVVWAINAIESLVEVRKDVICVAFVDGGHREAMASIDIGGHNLEDRLLQFDLEKSKLGFSSPLFFSSTSCANFNFSSI